MPIWIILGLNKLLHVLYSVYICTFINLDESYYPLITAYLLLFFLQFIPYF